MWRGGGSDNDTNADDVVNDHKVYDDNGDYEHNIENNDKFNNHSIC